MKKIIIVLIILCMAGICLAKEDTIVSTHFSLRDTPKYQPGFTHFEYVNPNAPKGGSITLSATGTFDSFNPYSERGDTAEGTYQLYDSLMTSSSDEIDVLYPLIAQKIEYAKDFTWIIFHLDERAKFQDQKPITAQDVVFSFNKFMTQGLSYFKTRYKDVDQALVLDKQRVKFTLKKPDLNLLYWLAGLDVLPKHYWEDKDLSQPTTTVPLGSSGFTIDSYKMGKYVAIKRLKNYWAKDLPVNKGQNNFDHIRYDYYKDEIVMLQAFKAGEFDFRHENVAKQWATLYKGNQFKNKQIIKEEIAHKIPQPMQSMVFNTQKEIFKDVRVREALGYFMDFEWLNKILFFNQYKRTRSYFQNTEYEAKELPSTEEIALLEPIKDKVPPRVFTEIYHPPTTDGSGNIRKQMRKAIALFKTAGWELSNRRMTHTTTGKPMEFEVLLWSPTMERVVIPIQDNLKKAGITMNIRRVDTSQYINRLRKRDFDMTIKSYTGNAFPSSSHKIVWHSQYIDSPYNTAGVQDPAIDYLTEKIDQNQTNKKALLYYGRALDRVLQFNFFVIPQWHLSKFRIAYKNKFSRPAIRPKYDIGFVDTWWINPDKMVLLPNRNSKN